MVTFKTIKLGGVKIVQHIVDLVYLTKQLGVLIAFLIFIYSMDSV
jgi:hypothetical protein